MNDEERNRYHGDLPQGLAAPASRSLAAAGIQRLDQIAVLSEAEIKRMHGIGPGALEQLRHALGGGGMSFTRTQEGGRG
jgi:hypothetical protein